MKNKEILRSITIGGTDGLSIPFALAAGLSRVVDNPVYIAAAMISLGVAGSLFMGVGSFLEGKKNIGHGKYFMHALIIAISYGTGSIISALPFFVYHSSTEALQYSAIITLLLLFITGYYESAVNEVNGWIGGFRVMLTGAATAAAAYWVATLFI